MFQGDREPIEAEALDPCRELRCKGLRAAQLADADLRGDFPGRCSADEYLGVERSEQRPGLGGKPRRIERGPQQCVRIDQHAQVYSQPSSSSGGSGSKNSGPTSNSPLKIPNWRLFGCFLIGTNRTTGCLPRAINTSSPRSARAISRDSCVLAS